MKTRSVDTYADTSQPPRPYRAQTRAAREAAFAQRRCYQNVVLMECRCQPAYLRHERRRGRVFLLPARATAPITRTRGGLPQSSLAIQMNHACRHRSAMCRASFERVALARHDARRTEHAGKNCSTRAAGRASLMMVAGISPDSSSAASASRPLLSAAAPCAGSIHARVAPEEDALCV